MEIEMDEITEYEYLKLAPDRLKERKEMAETWNSVLGSPFLVDILWLNEPIYPGHPTSRRESAEYANRKALKNHIFAAIGTHIKRNLP